VNDKENKNPNDLNKADTKQKKKDSKITLPIK